MIPAMSRHISRPVGKAELTPSFPCLHDINRLWVQKVSSDTCGGLSALESKRAETEYEVISVTETLRNESYWMKSGEMESREPHDNPWTLIWSINPEELQENMTKIFQNINPGYLYDANLKDDICMLTCM